MLPGPGYQLEPPSGFGVGWVVEVVFPTGQQQLPAWHGPGLVVDTARHEAADGEMEDWVRVLFEADGWDDWFSDPAGDPEVAFHKPERCQRKRCSCRQEGPCISKDRVRALQAAMDD